MDARLKDAQKKLMAGDFNGSLAIAVSCVEDDPGSLDALYMLAVSNRYLGRTDAAFDALARLKAVSPDYGRAFQEEGHLYKSLGDRARAMQAYEHAVRFNPMLDASWRALAGLRREANQGAAARAAEAQVARINTLPKELVAAGHHLSEGRLVKAEKLCRAILRVQPQHTEAMRLLAQVALGFNQLDDAAFLLDSAVDFNPQEPQLRLELIDVLRKQHRFTEAAAQSNRLLESQPDEVLFQSHHAINQMHLGDFEAAVALFDRVLQAVPDDPATLTSCGHALKTWGKQDAAIDSYRAAIAARAEHGDAWYGLANLKTYRFSSDEQQTLAAQLVRPDLVQHDRLYMHFTRAKALEDGGDWDAAFKELAAGNALKKASSSYSADQMQEELEAQARIVDQAFLDRCVKSGGAPAPDPIFIVGLPRAGSTLLEQILASHSAIDGTAELPHILSIAHRLRGRAGDNRYPESLLSLSDDEATRLGESYLAATRVHRKGAAFFTDKMPNNFRHIGLIRRILPKAKIIDARRGAMDCCFSGYKQLFAEGQEFTYDLSDLGRYYRDYVALMDHYDQAAPGMILRVQYEEVVADVEGQVRRLLDFLELPFEDACVTFHETKRAVRTASSEQVRSKINTKGLGAWKPYASHLGALKDALGALADG